MKTEKFQLRNESISSLSWFLGNTLTTSNKVRWLTKEWINFFARLISWISLSAWSGFHLFFSCVLLLYLFHHKYFSSVSLLSKNYLVIGVHVKTSYPPYQVTIAPIKPMKLSSSSKIKKNYRKNDIDHTTFH